MIGYIDDNLCAWGAWARGREPIGYPTRSPIAMDCGRFYGGRVPDNHAAETMDRAVAFLLEIHRDAVKLKYLGMFGDPVAANMLRISTVAYRARIAAAHAALDLYLRIIHEGDTI